MTSSPIPGAEGFLLLTLPDSHLSSPSSHPPTQRGPLALECVTIPVASPQADAFPDGRDVWLILRVGSFEMPISPTQTIYHSRSKRTYLFSTPSSRRVTVTLPTAHDLSSEQDLETFEVLMAQYSVLQETDPDTGLDDGDLKGRLVLVDEDDGQVLGSLAEEFNIKEDSRVHTKGKEKDPVIVEFPEGNQDVYVRSVQPEDDWILRSADYVSRGIMMATDLIISGLDHASTLYVANTPPTRRPLIFSPRSKKNARRIHTVSGAAVRVSHKTTGLIHDYIDKFANRAGGSRSPSPQPPQAGSSRKPASPPPLPPRHASGRNSPLPPTLQPDKPQKPRLLNRLFVSTDLILTTLENSAQTLLAHGTGSVARGVTHSYGPDAGDATQLAGDTIKNVGVVYIDARGVGRRALLRRFGKGVIKGRIGNREVVFGGDQSGNPTTQTYAQQQPDVKR